MSLAIVTLKGALAKLPISTLHSAKWNGASDKQ